MAGDSPLTDLAFSILLALKDEELHGYGLLQRLREMVGRASLRTGTVYAALARLQDAGLVAERFRAPSPDDDGRRRYYGITPRGLAAAQAEATRLQAILELARRKDVLPEAAGS